MEISLFKVEHEYKVLDELRTGSLTQTTRIRYL